MTRALPRKRRPAGDRPDRGEGVAVLVPTPAPAPPAADWLTETEAAMAAMARRLRELTATSTDIREIALAAKVLGELAVAGRVLQEDDDEQTPKGRSFDVKNMTDEQLQDIAAGRPPRPGPPLQ